MNFLREFYKSLQELFQVFQGYPQVFYWRFLRHVSKNFSRYQSWYFPEISWNIFFKFFNISIKNFFKYFFNNLKTLETIRIYFYYLIRIFFPFSVASNEHQRCFYKFKKSSRNYFTTPSKNSLENTMQQYRHFWSFINSFERTFSRFQPFFQISLQKFF